MLDIGWTELLIIAVVAIIVVGPKDLPGMLRSLGRYAGQLRRTANEFREQFDEALRESELDELRSSMNDIGDINPVSQVKNAISDSLDPLREAGEDIKGGIEGATSGTGEKKAKPPEASAATSSGDGEPADAGADGGRTPAPQEAEAKP